MKLLKCLALSLSLSLLLSGCSFSDTKSANEEITVYKEKLMELENKLTNIREEQLSNEADYICEINTLRKEIEELKNALKNSDSAEGEPPQVNNSSIGFTYKIENEKAVITGYIGSDTAVVVPATISGYPVEKIGEGAFKEKNIISVSLPNTVRSIGWFAFSECKKLESAIIPISVTDIGYEAFSGCDSLTVYVSSGSYAEKYAQSYGIVINAE